MKSNFNVDSAIKSLYTIDSHCSYYGKIKKNKIIFDDDERGNGNKAYYILTFYKKYARITSGLYIDNLEKSKKYYFSDFSSIDDLVDTIVIFNKYYFNSFKYCRMTDKKK